MHRSIFYGFSIAASLISALSTETFAAAERAAAFAIGLILRSFPPPDPRADLRRLTLPVPRQIIGLAQVREFTARLLARAVERFRVRRDLSGAYA